MKLVDLLCSKLNEQNLKPAVVKKEHKNIQPKYWKKFTLRVFYYFAIYLSLRLQCGHLSYIHYNMENKNLWCSPVMSEAPHVMGFPPGLTQRTSLSNTLGLSAVLFPSTCFLHTATKLISTILGVSPTLYKPVVSRSMKT